MISQENLYYKSMWIATKRIVRSGLISFFRNGFVSLASVLVMTVTLFVIGSILFLNAVLGASLEQIEDKVDINVYFIPSADEEDIFSIQRNVEALPEVAEVAYTSRREALTQFEERHSDDQLTLQALDELDENPLGASLSIKAKETSQYESIAMFLTDDVNVLGSGGAAIIDNINFFQNQVAIERLTDIIDSSERVGLGVSLVLIIASIIIVFNTIRLAIYTAREEIAVMQLVGASNMYVRGPFVLEGVLYGFVAGIFTLLVFYPLTAWLGPSTASFFGDINLFEYYLGHMLQFILIIVGSGIILGAFSSYLAVRKYLKV